MVQAVVPLRGEIGEEPGEPIPHAEPVGMAETSVTEVHGGRELAIRPRVDVMLLEGGRQGAHTGWTVRHPWWCRAGGWRRQGDAGPQLQFEKGRHPLTLRERRSRLDLAPVAPGLGRVEKIVGGLVDRQAQDALGMGSDIGQGDGPATGVTVQVKLVQAGGLGGLADCLDLHRDAVAGWRRRGPSV